MTFQETVLRGMVYLAKPPWLDEPHYFVVVSNNRRNQRWSTYLALMLTTTPKDRVADAGLTVVEIDHQQVRHGRVVCDDFVTLESDDIIRADAGLTALMMGEIEKGIHRAIGR